MKPMNKMYYFNGVDYYAKSVTNTFINSYFQLTSVDFANVFEDISFTK